MLETDENKAAIWDIWSLSSSLEREETNQESEASFEFYYDWLLCWDKYQAIKCRWRDIILVLYSPSVREKVRRLQAVVDKNKQSISKSKQRK